MRSPVDRFWAGLRKTRLLLVLWLLPGVLWAQEGTLGTDGRIWDCFQDAGSLYPGRNSFWLDEYDREYGGSARVATRGTFRLHRQGSQVDAIVTVIHHATAIEPGSTEANSGSGEAPVLFTVPAGYRPLHTITREVELRRVGPNDLLLSLAGGSGPILELQVDPLGAVRYRDVTRAAYWRGHWGFVLDTSWVTATVRRAGRYTHPDEPRSRYELRRQGETVAVVLRGLASPIPRLSRASEVLFHLPHAYRPLIPVIREVEGWPVHENGSLHEARVRWEPVRMAKPGGKGPAWILVDDPLGRQRWEPYRFTLQIDPDGAVRYGKDANWDGVDHLNYTLVTTWTAADTRWPLPDVSPMYGYPPNDVSISGYDNGTVHHGGKYWLRRQGDRVTATLTANRSDLTHPDVLFTIDADFRPATTIEREVVAQAMMVDGRLRDGEAWLFRVRVDPDGTVRQVSNGDGAGLAYGAYRLETAWGATPVAGDRVALEAVHAHFLRPLPDWDRYPVWAAPDLWLRPDVPLGEWRGVTTNAEGRVVELELGSWGGQLPVQLGDLSALRVLSIEARMDHFWVLHL